MVISQALAARHASRLRTALWVSHPLAGAPARAIVMLGSVALLSAVPRTSGSGSPGGRQFWWGRQRTWMSQLDPQYRHHIERRYKVLKHKHAESMQRKGLWDREITQRESRWRILSSWGEVKGYGGRWVSTDRLPDPKDEGESAKQNHMVPNSAEPTSEGPEPEQGPGKSRQRVRMTMDELKRQLEDDPYRVIFGHRQERLERSGPWSPHGIMKNISKRLGAMPFGRDDVRRYDSEVDQSFSAGPHPSHSSDAESSRGFSSRSSSYEFVQGGSGRGSASMDSADIDPITMRKVQRSSPPRHEDVIDLPVKRSSSQLVRGSDSGERTTSKDSPSPVSRAAAGNAFNDRTQNFNPEVKPSSSKHDRPIDPIARALAEALTPGTPALRGSSQKCASNWLAKEGFGDTGTEPARGKSGSEAQRRQDARLQPQATEAIKIGSNRTTKPAPKSSSNSQEDDENLDLLRPSDVRASAGIIKKSRRPTQVKKEDSRPTDEVVKTPDPQPLTGSAHGAPQAGDIASMRQGRSKGSDPAVSGSKGSESAHEVVKQIREIYEQKYGSIDVNHRQASQRANVPPDQSTDRLRGRQRDSVATQVLLPKDEARPTTRPADSTSDSSAHEQQAGSSSYHSKPDCESLAAKPSSGTNVVNLQSSIDGSYPSSGEMARHWEGRQTVLREEVQEIEEFLKDIDTQLSSIAKERTTRAAATIESTKTAKASTSETIPPSIYKILAFDPTTQEVASAMTTSSSVPKLSDSAEEILSPAQVIPRLNYPARFIAHIGRLQAEGFEIVSGGGDVLVLKKVREPVIVGIDQPRPGPALADGADSAGGAVEARPLSYPFINPIDGTTTTGNFASPTGFVNYNTLLPSQFAEAEEDEPPTSGQSTSTRPSSTKADHLARQTVTRQEDVFSGTRTSTGKARWRDEKLAPEDDGGNAAKKEKGKATKVASRMFWAGAGVAACSYAVSVVAEFFRTGGSTGAGIQGF